MLKLEVGEGYAGHVVPSEILDALPLLEIVWNYDCGWIQRKEDGLYVRGGEIKAQFQTGEENFFQMIAERGPANAALAFGFLNNPELLPEYYAPERRQGKAIMWEIVFPGTVFGFSGIPAVERNGETVVLPVPRFRIPDGIKPGLLLCVSLFYRHGQWAWRLRRMDYFFLGVLMRRKPSGNQAQDHVKMAAAP